MSLAKRVNAFLYRPLGFAATACLLCVALSCNDSANDAMSSPTDTYANDTETGQVDASMRGAERSAKYVQLRDEPGAIADLECEGDLFPGADIDSVVLYSTPALGAVKATLEACSWQPKGTHCPSNSGGKPSGAEGKKDGNAFEGFTSLNGGVLVCQWSQGQLLELGNIVNVLEVGPAGELESFQVRACRDLEGNECGEWQTGTAAQLTFPASTILPQAVNPGVR